MQTVELTEADWKRIFAAETLRDKDSFAVAQKLFPGDTMRSLSVARDWPHDSAVVSHQAELIEIHGEEYFLPTRSDLAREVWDMAKKERDPEAKAKAYKLYADIRGFIEKPGTTINNNIGERVTNVLVIGDETPEDFEKLAMAQQAKLLENATSRH